MTQSSDKEIEQDAKNRMLTPKSVGEFNPADWISEGNHLFASSKVTRATWVIKRKKMKRKLVDSNWPFGAGMWADIEGLPKASYLLLGYAVEMYLKAALSQAYRGCSEEMFTREVRAFSHHFNDIANEISFETSVQDKEDLETLSKMVRFGARYPLNEKDISKYISAKNQRTATVWNKSAFARMRRLGIRIKKYALKVGGTNESMAAFCWRPMGSDGYVAFRAGGHLPPRITYRLSSEQRAAKQEKDILLREFVRSEELIQIELLWDSLLIKEDRYK